MKATTASVTSENESNRKKKANDQQELGAPTRTFVCACPCLALLRHSTSPELRGPSDVPLSPSPSTSVARARTRHGAARWRAAIERNKVEHADELTLALHRIQRLVRRVLRAACCGLCLARRLCPGQECDDAPTHSFVHANL